MKPAQKALHVQWTKLNSAQILPRALLLSAAIGLAACTMVQPSVRVEPAQAPEVVVNSTPPSPEPESEKLPSRPVLPKAQDDPSFWQHLSDGRRFTDCDYDPKIGTWAQRLVGDKRSFKAHAQRFLPYLDYVWRRAQALDMPAEVALMPLVESDYRQVYGSYGSPGGWWQLMPETARGFGMSTARGNDERLDPIKSTDAALQLLSDNANRFERDWLLAIFAYNVGGLRVQRALEAKGLIPGKIEHVSQLGLPQTTEDHLHRMIAWGCILSNPTRYGAELPDPLNEHERFEIRSAPKALPPRAIAAAIGGELGKQWLLQHPNLAKKTQIQSERFLAPAGISAVLANLTELDKYQTSAESALPASSERAEGRSVSQKSAATPPSRKRDNPVRTPASGNAKTPRVIPPVPETYAVGSGDSLWLIARRFDMRVKEILALNPGLTRETVLQRGQKIRLK